MIDMDHRSMLTGIFLPICTPFAEDESVDYHALSQDLAFYGATRVKGYLALGSNGENRSLTEDEKVRVLATIVQAKRKGQIVMAGAAYEAQRDTERFFKTAANLGSDFGLLLSPSYFKKQMTDEVLRRYYWEVADTSPVPILIYNAPGFNGMSLSVELVAELAQHPNIVGIKDSSSTGATQFVDAASEKFHLLAGSIDHLYQAVKAGAVGGTVSLANSFPEPAIRLFECAVRRDDSNGPACQEKCSRANAAISGKHGVPGVKAAMNLAGLTGGIPRRPLRPLTPRQVFDLKETLIAEGLLD